MEITPERVYNLLEELDYRIVGIYLEKEMGAIRTQTQYISACRDEKSIPSIIQGYTIPDGFKWKAVSLAYDLSNPLLIVDLVHWFNSAPDKDDEGLIWSLYQYYYLFDDNRRNSLLSCSFIDIP